MSTTMEVGTQIAERAVTTRRKIVSRPITIKELCQRLDITPMTIRSWRMGSPQRRRLPCVTRTTEGGRNSVVFEDDEIANYLAEYKPGLLRQWIRTSSKV